MEELESTNGSIITTIVIASCALMISLSKIIQRKRERSKPKCPLPQLRTNIHAMEFRDGSLQNDTHHSKRVNRSKSVPYLQNSRYSFQENANLKILRELDANSLQNNSKRNSETVNCNDYEHMYCYHSLLAQSHIQRQSVQLTEWRDETIGISIPFSPILFSIAHEERQAPLILLTFRYLRQEGHKVTITIEQLSSPISAEEYRDISLTNIGSCAEILSLTTARIGSAQRPQAEYCYVTDKQCLTSNGPTCVTTTQKFATADMLSENVRSTHMNDYNYNNRARYNTSNDKSEPYGLYKNEATEVCAPVLKEEMCYVLVVFVVFDKFAFTVQYVAPTRVRSILPTAFYELIRGIKVVDALPTTSYYLLTEPRLGMGIRLPLSFVITTDAQTLERKGISITSSDTINNRGDVNSNTTNTITLKEVNTQSQKVHKEVHINENVETKLECSWYPLMIGASRGTSRFGFAMNYEPSPHTQSYLKEVKHSVQLLSSLSPREKQLYEHESVKSKMLLSSSCLEPEISPLSPIEEYSSLLEEYLTKRLQEAMIYFNLSLLPSEECKHTISGSTEKATKVEEMKIVAKETEESKLTATTAGRAVLLTPTSETNTKSTLLTDKTNNVVNRQWWPVNTVQKENLVVANAANSSIAANNITHNSKMINNVNNSNNGSSGTFIFRRSLSNITTCKKCDNDDDDDDNDNNNNSNQTSNEINNKLVVIYSNNNNNNNVSRNISANFVVDDKKRLLSNNSNIDTHNMTKHDEQTPVYSTEQEHNSQIKAQLQITSTVKEQNVNVNVPVANSYLFGRATHLCNNFRVHMKRTNNNNNLNHNGKAQVKTDVKQSSEAKEEHLYSNREYYHCEDSVTNIDARAYELVIGKNGNFSHDCDEDVDESNNNNNSCSNNNISRNNIININGNSNSNTLFNQNQFKLSTLPFFNEKMSSDKTDTTCSSSWTTHETYFCVNYVYVSHPSSVSHLLLSHPLDDNAKHKELASEEERRAIYVTFYVPISLSEWASFHFLAASNRHTVKEVISFATNVMQSLTLGNHYGQEACVLYCNVRQCVMPFTISLLPHWVNVEENVIDDPFALIRVNNNTIDVNNSKYTQLHDEPDNCTTIHDTVVVVRPFPLPPIRTGSRPTTTVTATHKHLRRPKHAYMQGEKVNSPYTVSNVRNNSMYYPNNTRTTTTNSNSNSNKMNKTKLYLDYQRRLIREIKRLLYMYVDHLCEENEMSVLSCKSTLLANGSIAVMLVYGLNCYVSHNASFARSGCGISSYTSEFNGSIVSEHDERTSSHEHHTNNYHCNYSSNVNKFTLEDSPSVSSIDSSICEIETKYNTEVSNKQTNELLQEEEEELLLEQYFQKEYWKQHLAIHEEMEENSGSFNPLATYQAVHEHKSQCSIQGMSEIENSNSIVSNNMNNKTSNANNTRADNTVSSQNGIHYYPRTFTELDNSSTYDNDNHCMDGSNSNKAIRIAVVVCPSRITVNSNNNNYVSIGNSNNINCVTSLAHSNTHIVPKSLLFLANTSIIDFHKTRSVLMKIASQVHHRRSQII